MEDCVAVEVVLEKLRRDRAELAMALEEVKGRVREAVEILSMVKIGSGRVEVVAIARAAREALERERPVQTSPDPACETRDAWRMLL